jgi:hypothetical protein
MWSMLSRDRAALCTVSEHKRLRGLFVRVHSARLDISKTGVYSTPPFVSGKFVPSGVTLHSWHGILMFVRFDGYDDQNSCIGQVSKEQLVLCTIFFLLLLPTCPNTVWSRSCPRQMVPIVQEGIRDIFIILVILPVGILTPPAAPGIVPRVTGSVGENNSNALTCHIPFQRFLIRLLFIFYISINCFKSLLAERLVMLAPLFRIFGRARNWTHGQVSRIENTTYILA